MTEHIARTRRNTTNLYEAGVALRNLRGQMPEVDLCARLQCNKENLKRWAYIGVPGSRSAEVIALWHELRHTSAA
jgi:hypothetical protein